MTASETLDTRAPASGAQRRTALRGSSRFSTGRGRPVAIRQALPADVTRTCRGRVASVSAPTHRDTASPTSCKPALTPLLSDLPPQPRRGEPCVRAGASSGERQYTQAISPNGAKGSQPGRIVNARIDGDWAGSSPGSGSEGSDHRAEGR